MFFLFSILSLEKKVGLTFLLGLLSVLVLQIASWLANTRYVRNAKFFNIYFSNPVAGKTSI